MTRGRIGANSLSVSLLHENNMGVRAYEEEAQCLTEPSQAPRTRGRSRIIYKIRSCITVTCGDHAYPDSDSRGIVRDQSVAISAVRLVDSDLPHDFEPGILLHVEARGTVGAAASARSRLPGDFLRRQGRENSSAVACATSQTGGPFACPEARRPAAPEPTGAGLHCQGLSDEPARDELT